MTERAYRSVLEDYPGADDMALPERPISRKDAFPVQELEALLGNPQRNEVDNRRMDKLISSSQVVDYYAHRYWYTEINLEKGIIPEEDEAKQEKEYIKAKGFMDRFAYQGGGAVKEILIGKYGFQNKDFEQLGQEKLLRIYFEVFGVSLSYQDKQVAGRFKERVGEFDNNSLWGVIKNGEIERAKDYALHRMPRRYN